MATEFFVQRPPVTPTIYAYSLPDVASHKGYIKVGYTERDVEKRIAEQMHTSGVAYKILFKESAMCQDGTCFSDHDVHAILRRKGFVQLKEGADRNEWFSCSAGDVRAAITELTSLLSRRSVYCSKYPNSEFSVTQFDDVEGNIRFRRIQHKWKDGKCIYCSANKGQYERGDELETHAYEWIHTLKPEEIFKMKFDVIISNPPYQLNDGGAGKSAKPIYHIFVERAKKLKPRYLTMIIPSRWFSGGKDVTEFRSNMIQDDHIRILHDYVNAGDCFSGVDIKGGVCYFLWDRENSGPCEVITHKTEGVISKAIRPLKEDGIDTFVRDNEMISILHKVRKKGEITFDSIVSTRDPFGYDIREENSLKTVPHKYNLKKTTFEDVVFYYNGWRKAGVGYVSSSSVNERFDWVDKYKVLVPNAWGSGDTSKDRIKPFIVGPHSVCTETYLVIGPFDTEDECNNAVSYINTSFFHSLVSLLKISQHATKTVYQFVPLQDFTKPWTDEELYEKYDLTADEIAYVNLIIRPMDSDGETLNKQHQSVAMYLPG